MLTLDQEFKDIIYAAQDLSRDGYDNCIFIRCDFTKADLADISFTDCTFNQCDFSMANMDNIGLKDVQFIECKFVGTDLSKCSPFLLKMSFDNCQMDLSIFSEMKLKSTIFRDCQLKEADFTGSDLTEASFQDSDLSRAIFKNTNLTKTNFSLAQNYTLDPSKNILKKTIFSKNGVMGLLSNFDIKIVD